MNTSLSGATDKSFAVSVLVIDDNELWRDAARFLCTDLFKDLGDDLNIVEVGTIDEGLLALTRQQFHIVLLDRQLVDINGQPADGIAYIPEVLAVQPNAQLLMYTADDDPRDIVQALHLGASGYLVKEGKAGFEEYRKEQLRQALKRAKVSIDRERLLRTREPSASEFVAKSSAMKRLVHQLEALAEVSKPVLFLGATGLGKGAAARQIHGLRAKYLKQANRPFLNLNISNLAGEMALSELFGHEANSFTGAGNKTKQGYFELANGGDIFLDEIGEASPELQARLLKVIEEREFQRVGGNRTLKTNARVIFATNKDLKQMVKEGAFREDLYMRISTFVIELPRLEERKEDIPELVRVFLGRINSERSGDPVLYDVLPSDFIDHLMRDHIPGNIRGLENDLSRVIVFVPKDQKGRPILSNWKAALGLSKRYTPQLQLVSNALTLEQFINTSTEFVRPGFPGLTKMLELMEKKVLQEVEKKFSTLTARAEILGVPISNASRRYAALKQENKAQPPEKAQTKMVKGQYGKDKDHRQFEHDRS